MGFTMCTNPPRLHNPNVTFMCNPAFSLSVKDSIVLNPVLQRLCDTHVGNNHSSIRHISYTSENIIK